VKIDSRTENSVEYVNQTGNIYVEPPFLCQYLIFFSDFFFTPKCHIIINHIPGFLQRSGNEFCTYFYFILHEWKYPPKPTLSGGKTNVLLATLKLGREQKMEEAGDSEAGYFCSRLGTLAASD